jgi:prevent-host-death family protein
MRAGSGIGVRVRLDEAKTYTMRQLSQRTAEVIEEINKCGEPALITKHGRIIAMITPLADARVESIVLSSLVSNLINQNDAENGAGAPHAYSSEDVLRDLTGS